MTNTIGKVSDFTIRIIMVFTTIVSLVFFAGIYTNMALVFGLIALVFVLAIITKGLSDIFSKE